MAARKTYVSSYMLKVGDDSVGFTTRLVIDGEKKFGNLIGFDLKPEAKKYNNSYLLYKTIKFYFIFESGLSLEA
jgi:hypothetical protein